MSEKPPKKALRDYQVADLCFYMMNERLLNLSDPGSGKTPSVCVYTYFLWNDKGVRTAWAMPKSLLKKNKDELLDFTHFKDEDVVIVNGTPKEREKQMTSDAKVFLMTFDCFSNNWQKLMEHHPDLDALFVDEIHLGYSTDGSKRTQNMYLAMKQIKYFLAMTGTIINGRLSSAFPPIKVIEPRYYGSYNGFLGQHALVDEYGKICAWQNHTKLAQIFMRHGIRHTFEEIYGKQEVVMITETVQMSEKQRAAYDEFEETALLQLEDMWLDAKNEGVALIRARQIMAHPWSEKLKITPETELTGKDERLLIYYGDAYQSGKPLLVYTALVPEQERCVALAKKAGLRVGLINGSVSAKKRAEVDEDFRAGDLDVVVASPATASIGYNWGHVDTVVFVSLDYMSSNFEQAYKRAIRGKRSRPLLVYVMEYENSIDQKIMRIVEYKSQMAHLVDDSKEVIRISVPSKQDQRKVRDLNINGKISMGDLIK